MRTNTALIFLCSSAALASGGTFETLVPNIKSASISHLIKYDAYGMFHYSYSLSNPRPNTGVPTSFSFNVKVDTPQPLPTGLSRPRGDFLHPSDTGYWCDDETPQSGVNVLPIGGVSGKRWGMCVTVKPVGGLWPNGLARFSASSNPVAPERYLLPGQSVQDAFELISPSPPGIVDAFIKPYWDPSIADDDPRRPLVPDGIEPLCVNQLITAPVDPSLYPKTLQDPFLGSPSNRPDAQSFLRYLNPGAEVTVLPASTAPTTFNLVILYGPTIKPGSFQAHLDNKKVTSRFHPCPSCAEVIPLTFDPRDASHVLHLEVKGNVGKKVLEKSDRLVFQVGTGGRECEDRHDRDDEDDDRRGPRRDEGGRH